jgi:cyclophilin family peptidyl-prolyl cis-trans isomerase/HEAT repeat protein
LRYIVLLVLAIVLRGGWQIASAADQSLRSIEVAELHRSLDPLLIASLDAAPDVAARAALAIGRTKRAAGAPPLRAHLAARDGSVRAMCAYALGLLADAPSLDALRALARHDTSSAVRYAAADAVGRIVANDPRLATLGAATDLLIVARADGDPYVRAHAVAQLDAFRDAPFAADLGAALGRLLASERDERARWHVAWTLARGFATHVDERVLSAALHDRNDLVRSEAARALGKRTDGDDATLLRCTLDDPSWHVQFDARESLKRLANEAPTEHLTAMPAGIHLPPVPPFAAPSATPRPAASVGSERLRAPDPQTLALAGPVLATTARDLAGPAPGPHPRVRIRTTKGDVVVRLYPEWAPSTVANFLALAARGYFDGNRWFRIVPDFVVQTGDPNDDGEGDAGYTIPAEENPLEEPAGVIAMGLNYDGNKPLRDSAGTQFYVTLSPQLHLDRDFSVFGEVQSGFDVLVNLIESDRIVSVARLADG